MDGRTDGSGAMRGSFQDERLVREEEPQQFWVEMSSVDRQWREEQELMENRDRRLKTM